GTISRSQCGHTRLAIQAHFPSSNPRAAEVAITSTATYLNRKKLTFSGQNQTRQKWRYLPRKRQITSTKCDTNSSWGPTRAGTPATVNTSTFPSSNTTLLVA